MTIVEPVTMLTDYILALAALAFAVLLPRPEHSRRFSIRLWRAGFLVIAAAAAVGGTYHGFALYLSDAALGILWRSTVYLIVAGAGTITWAVFSGPLGRRGPSTAWLIAGGLLTAGGFALLQTGFSLHPHFNHNDLYHCIQIVALYLFFRGARLAG